MRYRGAFLSLLMVVLTCAAVVPDADAQLFRRRAVRSTPIQSPVMVPNCPTGVCEIPSSIQPGLTAFPTAQPVSEPVEEAATVEADNPHVRCIINGSCGSGTICGANADGAYVVTNAHVTGTTLGRAVSIDLISEGRAVRTSGRTVMTGYSDRRMVDFSIVFVQGLSSKRYMPMLKTEPEGQPFGTTGAPRCVWPLVTKSFSNPRNYGDGLITGTPNAIGGQSGSAIYNADGLQIALLTWSIGGRCAGQKTAKLWQVATERNVELADPRPEGLVEVCDDASKRPETANGIFGSFDGLTETAEGKFRPFTANMISNVVGSDMEQLPIWYVPGGDDGGGGNDGGDDDGGNGGGGDVPPGCYKLTDKEWELIEFLRAQQAEAGLREKAIDYVALIRLIMELLSLFNQRG